MPGGRILGTVVNMIIARLMVVLDKKSRVRLKGLVYRLVHIAERMPGRRLGISGISVERSPHLSLRLISVSHMHEVKEVSALRLTQPGSGDTRDPNAAAITHRRPGPHLVLTGAQRDDAA